MKPTVLARSIAIASLTLSLGLLGGCVGDTGPAGEQGPIGEAGSNGTDGANGTNGTNGTNGSNGTNGTNGTDGADGLDGAGQVLTISRIGRTTPTAYDASAAEIVQYDSTNRRIYSVNGSASTIDVFDTSTGLTNPVLSTTIDVKQMLVTNSVPGATSTAVIGGANSIALRNGTLAVAVESAPKTATGWLLLIRASDNTFLRAAQLPSPYALPDMITITPDGTKAVAAIEGEPLDYRQSASTATGDPEGGVAIMDITTGALTMAGFTAFNSGQARAAELPSTVRIYGRTLDNTGTFVRNSTVAEDLEPEYLAVSSDSSTIYASMQENNALAVIDANTGAVTKICSLGFKDHRLPGNTIDTSDRDGASAGTVPLVNLVKPNGPLFGMYMPDSIATYAVNGVNYVVMANEGDTRADWGAENNEESSVSALTLDATAFPLVNGTAQTSQLYLGRLTVTKALEIDSNSDGVRDRARGDTDGDGDYDQLYVPGGRSFSIFRPDTCSMVYDSGDDFERITARRFPSNFNANSTSNSMDNRSDNKGPEPEGLAIGKVNGSTYAFIGLERMGGIMVYDISNPNAPVFVQYHSDRDFSLTPSLANSIAGLDLAPEGMVFVSSSDSQTGKPLVVVGNETSGNVSIYEVSTEALR